jgi:hypothetical protein
MHVASICFKCFILVASVLLECCICL